ncbi:fatty-acid--CoA ligase FadD4 [Arthrobacter ginkgonis]|uniref:Fatty-acid--CoA ligase FadD4 n=1 Tax=Arthrobacter ginkgonis TaxID=1630594 RepID=A0ABP7DBX5_9MICC
MQPTNPSSGNDAARNAYQWAVVDPDRVALIQHEEETTFGELIGRVNLISNHLRDLGLEAGDVVAGFMDNDPAYWAVSLAAQQVGLYYVPINSHLKADEAEYIVANSGAKVLVAGPAQAALLHAAGTATGAVHRYALAEAPPDWMPYAELGRGYPPAAPENRVAGAIMGYTSGTTGRPKGVKRQVGQESPEAATQRTLDMLGSFGLASSNGVHLVCSPLYHAAPAGFATGALHLGHTLVIHTKFDAAQVLADIERHSVTNSHMVPTHFHRLLSLPEEIRQATDTSSLEVVVHAGAPCPVSLKRRMLAWWGPIIWEYLGATEGIVAIASPSEWAAHPGTLGRPAAGAVQILDELGVEQPARTSGRIFFKSTMPFEYLGDAEKTEANRFGDLVTVGDLGLLDEEGYLFMQDRRNDLILSGGANVYPAEVEQALIDHPAVSDVGVIGVDDDEWGQVVVAVIQLNPGFSAGDDLRAELDGFARTALGSYKRPKRIEFLEEFPRTPSGKLLRRQLRDLYSSAAPRTATAPSPL